LDGTEWVKMNLGLMKRPLSGTPNKKHHFSLNCFHIQFSVVNRHVLMAPDIQVCLGDTMSPA
jgi:hypothetical protein